MRVVEIICSRWSAEVQNKSWNNSLTTRRVIGHTHTHAHLARTDVVQQLPSGLALNAAREQLDPQVAGAVRSLDTRGHGSQRLQGID